MSRSPHVHVPLYVRAHHPDAYRSGQWAEVLSVGYITSTFGDDGLPGRPVMTVKFVDGAIDAWPLHDPAADYEFSHQASDYDTFRVSAASAS